MIDGLSTKQKAGVASVMAENGNDCAILQALEVVTCAELKSIRDAMAAHDPPCVSIKPGVGGPG